MKCTTLLLALTVSTVARGAEPSEKAPRASDDTEKTAPDSPRAAVSGFLQLTREGNFLEAERRFLPSSLQGFGPGQAARQLKAVLDHHIVLDLDHISGVSEGVRDDGLPADAEELGRIAAIDGRHEPVRLVRQGSPASWRFSDRTIAQLKAWHLALPTRWADEHLPRFLLRSGPYGLALWQWLAFPLLLGLALALGRLLSGLTRKALSTAAARTRTQWDDAMLASVARPLTVAWALAVTYAGLPLLGLTATADNTVEKTLRAVAFGALFWALLNVIDTASKLLVDSSWARTRTASRTLLPLASRFTKVAVLAVAVVAVLSEVGYPVASLIAGLGIGGLAIALAAQKTVENLIGAFAIGLDQPLREGDAVKVEGVSGTVERIGLRSTRIRTMDRTLVTLPNGKLADMQIETYAPRDRIRFAVMVGLVYQTSAAQMREVLEGFNRTLQAQPKLFPEGVVVRFAALGASSLDIEVNAWFQTLDYSEFQLIRENVLLSFLEVIEKAGTEIAFPTRTLHWEGGGPTLSPTAR